MNHGDFFHVPSSLGLQCSASVFEYPPFFPEMFTSKGDSFTERVFAIILLEIMTRLLPLSLSWDGLLWFPHQRRETIFLYIWVLWIWRTSLPEQYSLLRSVSLCYIEFNAFISLIFWVGKIFKMSAFPYFSQNVSCSLLWDIQALLAKSSSYPSNKCQNIYLNICTCSTVYRIDEILTLLVSQRLSAGWLLSLAPGSWQVTESCSCGERTPCPKLKN